MNDICLSEIVRECKKRGLTTNEPAKQCIGCPMKFYCGFMTDPAMKPRYFPIDY